MRTANPALHDKIFTQIGPVGREEAMTIQGTANKAGLLLFLLMIPALYVWEQFFSAEDKSFVWTFVLVGGIGGFVVAMILVFKQTMAPILAPIYALLEGMALGGISAVFEMKFPGIVVQAVGLTFGTLFALLMAYKSRIIEVTENFKLMVVAATGGIALVYLVGFVLRFFGTGIPYIHESGMIGIGFSVFVIIVAAMNLVLDFDFIENGAQRGAPKYMEWYGAFGLLVTLIWLYIEFLRLLAKLRSR